MSLTSLRHDHVALRVSDYAGTVAWYTSNLGFQVDREWPFGEMQLAYLSRGTAKIELLAGAPTTHGLKALAGAYPSQDAPAVGRLKTAGAIPLGHTNCPTLAVRWHTEGRILVYGKKTVIFD